MRSNSSINTRKQVLGKAMYEGILIEPRFALHFLNKLLGNENHFDEMRLLDKDVYKNLLFMKKFEGDFEDLGLCFDVTTSKALGTWCLSVEFNSLIRSNAQISTLTTTTTTTTHVQQ